MLGAWGTRGDFRVLGVGKIVHQIRGLLRFFDDGKKEIPQNISSQVLSNTNCATNASIIQRTSICRLSSKDGALIQLMYRVFIINYMRSPDQKYYCAAVPLVRQPERRGSSLCHGKSTIIVVASVPT